VKLSISPHKYNGILNEGQPGGTDQPNPTCPNNPPDLNIHSFSAMNTTQNTEFNSSEQFKGT